MGLEDIFYKNIIRPILYKSHLGKVSIDGKANTGVNFDYMYKGKPHGEGLFGKFVDYILLNLPAVKMTQNRKEKIKAIIKTNKIDSQEMKLLDIASGPSRYCVEVAAEMGGNISAVCIDMNEEDLNYGRKLAEDYGVSHLIEYRNGDIFNPSIYDGVNPHLTIISGLYVYTDDETMKKSLRVISEVIPYGSSIIIDNQIKNPSRKLMEKVCTTTYNKSWVLVYREKDYMESIVQNFFHISESYVDDIGMYHIIEAKKVN